jgi:hypothetical protein
MERVCALVTVIYFVECLLKAIIVKPAETAVANTPVAGQWLSSRHVMVATDTHATIEELLEAVFSVRSLPRLYNEDQLPSAVSRGERESAGRQSVEKLVVEAGDSSGTQRKGNVLLWKPLPSSAVKIVTENTKSLRHSDL